MLSFLAHEQRNMHIKIDIRINVIRFICILSALPQLMGVALPQLMGVALPQLVGGGAATLVVLLFKNFSVFAYIAEGFFFAFVFKHNKESFKAI